MPNVPFRVSLMPAALVAAPFTRPNWVFAEKYDGVRILAYKEGLPRSACFAERYRPYGPLSRGRGGGRETALQVTPVGWEVVVCDARRVSFAEWTKVEKLRHFVFPGLRDGKKPIEVVRQEA